ncbi:hypothetical protein MSG28_009884 [Choristoneura fumiferana]|uniref:Uncharacterized protein n=1 Tax=Choristoneura fumiferana TaxID=7141 RepID=A0ACC0JD08_CHOFU|nr:hypothetical protein MSG28_009884 [Choristoneura fumiferana]
MGFAGVFCLGLTMALAMRAVSGDLCSDLRTALSETWSPSKLTTLTGKSWRGRVLEGRKPCEEAWLKALADKRQKRHQGGSAPTSADFSCLACGRTCRSRIVLVSHQRRVHRQHAKIRLEQTRRPDDDDRCKITEFNSHKVLPEKKFEATLEDVYNCEEPNPAYAKVYNIIPTYSIDVINGTKYLNGDTTIVKPTAFRNFSARTFFINNGKREIKMQLVGVTCRNLFARAIIVATQIPFSLKNCMLKQIRDFFKVVTIYYLIGDRWLFILPARTRSYFFCRSDKSYKTRRAIKLAQRYSLSDELGGRPALASGARPLTSDLVVQIIGDGNLSDFDESDLKDQFLQYNKEGGGSTSSDEDVQNQLLFRPESSPHNLTSTSSHDRSSRGRLCSRGQNQSPFIIEAQSRQPKLWNELSPAVFPDRYPYTLKAGNALVTLLVLQVSMGDGPSVNESKEMILGAVTAIFCDFEAFPGVCRRSRTFGSVPHQHTASLPGYQRHSVRALAIAPHNLGLQSSGNVGTNERPSENVVESGVAGQAAGARGAGEAMVAETVHWSPTRNTDVTSADPNSQPELLLLSPQATTHMETKGKYQYSNMDMNKIMHALPCWHAPGTIVHQLQLVSNGATEFCEEVVIEIKTI